MAKIKILPKYTRPVPLQSGRTGYYWELPTWARPPAERGGKRCPLVNTPLGTDLVAAIRRAEALNQALDEWRLGVALSPTKGTVTWLFSWYRQQPRFRKASFKTRRDYASYMARLEAVKLKTMMFGDYQAAKVTATSADRVYLEMCKAGIRTGVYAMQTCRRVWNEAIRHKDKTGIEHNPFSKMGLTSTATKGNKAATRAQYDAFRAVAHEKGAPYMAVGAALCFELAQRVGDAYSLKTGDDPERGFFWADYIPGKSISLRQSKTNVAHEWPLSDGEGPLYPELEAELAQAPRAHRRIVPPMDESAHGKLFRAIRDAAGLPADITPTSFRHGGATELGDAEVFDTRPITAHKTLQQTATYNKANQRKARKAARKRRALIESESE